MHAVGAVLHRLEPATELAAAQREYEPGKEREHRRDGDEIRAVALQRTPARKRLAIGCEARDLAEHVLLDDERERHRAQRKIEVAQSQARERDHGADKARERHRDEQTDRRRPEHLREPRRRKHTESGKGELRE